MTGNFAKLYLCFLFGCWENSVTRKEIFLIFSLTCSILLFVCKRMKKWAEHRERIAGCFCCVQWWKSGICNFKLLVFRRFLQQPNRIFVCIIGVVGITFWVPKLILLGSEIETLIFFFPLYFLINQTHQNWWIQMGFVSLPPAGYMIWLFWINFLRLRISVPPLVPPFLCWQAEQN